MMWVAAFAVVGIVLAIAAALVFREAARLSEYPPDAVFDPDDALSWVVAHLDDLVAATLTEADVRRIIGYQMEFFRHRGVAHSGTRADPEVPLLLAPEEIVEYIVERCAETGEEYLPEQVEGVMGCQLEYLRRIGAIGREVEEPSPTRPSEPPEDPRPDS